MTLLVYFDSSLAISRILLKSVLKCKLSSQLKLVLVDTCKSNYFSIKRRIINISKIIFFLPSRHSRGMLRYPKNHRVFKLESRDIDEVPIEGKINGLVIGCGRIFGAEAIKKFEILINYHNSMLPNYKGLEVSSFELINKELYSGITFHHITDKLDEGEPVIQIAFPITKDLKTCSELELAKSRHGAELIPSILAFYLHRDHQIISRNINHNVKYTSKTIKDYKSKIKDWKNKREWQ